MGITYRITSPPLPTPYFTFALRFTLHAQTTPFMEKEDLFLVPPPLIYLTLVIDTTI